MFCYPSLDTQNIHATHNYSTYFFNQIIIYRYDSFLKCKYGNFSTFSLLSEYSQTTKHLQQQNKYINKYEHIWNKNI